MRYLSRAYARLSHISRLSPASNRIAPNFNFLFRNYAGQVLWTEDEEMGKDKAQMSLKTPKGTQDCNCCQHVVQSDSIADYFQGRERTW